MDKVTVDQARALVEATTFDIFNERDQTKRRQLMEKYWASDITCYSPFGASAGYDAMDQLWDGLHADEKSTWAFQRSGDLWLNFNIIMQPWVYGPIGEEGGMKGWDVLIVNDDGRVQELYAMIDGVSTHTGTA
ncbi:hypothetical protein OIDMADRAFT_149980 [Oidiodendron maius Zn]|uniref:SnoaL-like domain-containing protein n=1 Tax=Oidiodendron maius (strain Zn) TaxID=913774 RepID=A0A0C3C1Q1_OIDMZ|nr:hypothetical protein OIDMADRAFT_149980 [Oidiodendron maius Zn]